MHSITTISIEYHINIMSFGAFWQFASCLSQTTASRVAPSPGQLGPRLPFFVIPTMILLLTTSYYYYYYY